MPRSAPDIILAIAFGALIVALTYPLAAPVIASATTGAVLDWAAYLSALDLSAVQEFWTSGSWVGCRRIARALRIRGHEEGTGRARGRERHLR